MFAASGRVLGIAWILRPFGHAGFAPDEYRRLTPTPEYVVANYRRPHRHRLRLLRPGPLHSGLQTA